MAKKLEKYETSTKKGIPSFLGGGFYIFFRCLVSRSTKKKSRVT